MVREFFRHGSNALMVGAAAAIGIASLAGRTKLLPRSVAMGIGLFYTSEYSTHRFLLHAKPSNNAFVHGLQRRLHYDHHLDPARLDLLFLPVWALVPAQGLFTAAYALVTRDRDKTASLVLGNLIGLIFYEWVHYIAHIPYKPRTPYGRYIKKYHLWHHFKNEKLWFGVTNPSIDVISGTYLDVTQADRSGSTRVLFH